MPADGTGDGPVPSPLELKVLARSATEHSTLTWTNNRNPPERLVSQRAMQSYAVPPMAPADARRRSRGTLRLPAFSNVPTVRGPRVDIGTSSPTAHQRFTMDFEKTYIKRETILRPSQVHAVTTSCAPRRYCDVHCPCQSSRSRWHKKACIIRGRASVGAT
ncbi:hypothetical protein OH77DRAFT_386789 [Trametes cingulata]|nr:hypothetical protein OH77DRAFT_386789 [Trametes cingulata]